MQPIEIARRLAQMGKKKDACQAYGLAIHTGAAPEEQLEAAAYILQNKGDYKVSYTCFRDLYNAGHFQTEILPLMTAVFYEPNEKLLRTRYERNRKLLEKYPWLFRKDFPAFEDLPIQFFPYDEHSGYVPFYQDTMLFGDFVNVKHSVVSRNFFKDLDKPILASDVFSQYELEYLYDNVRKSEHIGRDNHIYLHYTDWNVFCAWLQVLNLRRLLEDNKFVFLIDEEVGQYPIDFKERFGVDYSQYSLRPVGLREISKLIWHTQLSSHNGGDFFNEVLDDHPNLLALTSIMFDNMEEAVAEWRKMLSQAKGSKAAKQEFLRQKGLDARVIQELCAIQSPTDKDIFTAIYLSSEDINRSLDPASRIVPAVLFQPHFPTIDYTLAADDADNTILLSKQYDRTCKSPIFRGFKYIKTFTPMRRFTTSHGATVKFMYERVLESEKKEAEQAGEQTGAKGKKQEKDKSISVVSDAVTDRVTNRSFMIDWQDRLYQDCVLVRFEDGKLNPKATFTALAAFLDIPYTESMTYCSMNGVRGATAFDFNARGFDPAPVYRTYDDFANDSERKYIEYFLRDAYAFYGYDFQYYDGQPMTIEQVDELVDDFSTLDGYIRKTSKRLYEGVQVTASDGDEEAAEAVRKQVQDQLLESQLKTFKENRKRNSRILSRGLRFLNRNNQPLHMMPKLELDPALLEQPLYH